MKSKYQVLNPPTSSKLQLILFAKLLIVSGIISVYYFTQFTLYLLLGGIILSTLSSCVGFKAKPTCFNILMILLLTVGFYIGYLYSLEKMDVYSITSSILFPLSSAQLSKQYYISYMNEFPAVDKND